MSNDEQIIRDLQQRWMESWRQRDANALENILADDFKLTLSNDPTKPYSRTDWMRIAPVLCQS